ncbi:glycine N-acyltransferase-like protein 3 [Sphaeramia orbicularis]|uniref:Glycine N-acyltransferase-like protein n=1 Tax=Sphaeramia orbicularis TaxID=375764 RepID=A0A673ADH8_9TELE|nr:glycine N-acyltransferase-like protein 3 [Sphaeramia orbicularis]
MKILNNHEMQIAEDVLLKHFPRSLKVYGVLTLNRNKPTTVEVLVDTWPDFNVIICRPDPKNILSSKFGRTVSYYSTDEQILRRMMSEENAVDWSSNLDIHAFDMLNAPMLQQLSSDRGISCRSIVVGRLLYLPDSTSLISPTVDSELESRLSSLDVSHADLVSQSWMFGADEQTVDYIKLLLSNFLSCCITDDQGQPVSWLLVYDFGALGFLYTRPEHRRKGYAKVLISTVAQRRLAQGCPVYAYVDENNSASYRLFKNLGFSDDPSYRAGWFEFNC